MAGQDPGPVTKADIEAKLNQIKGDVDSTAEAAVPYAVIAGIAGTVLLLILAYLLGRRKGKKRTTVIEVRRL